MTPIGINSNIPAAILSNSIQIGGPTVDRVPAGGRRRPRSRRHRRCDRDEPERTSGLYLPPFVRNGITIKEPKDFVGKKVGAPGLNAFLHVLFVEMAGGERRRSQEASISSRSPSRPWPTSSSPAASTPC